MLLQNLLETVVCVLFRYSCGKWRLRYCLLKNLLNYRMNAFYIKASETHKGIQLTTTNPAVPTKMALPVACVRFLKLLLQPFRPSF